MNLQLKIVVEQHVDGFVAYPIGLPAVIVGEGDTYEQAMARVTEEIAFYFEHYGDTVELEHQPLSAFVTETTLKLTHEDTGGRHNNA